MKKEVRAVSADAMSALMNYRWQGNVRELEHAIERAVILAHGPTVTVRELPPEVSQRRKHGASGDPLDLRAQERELIERALDRYKGNRRKAAQALNISTVTLWRKMKEYDISA
jgi:DNA-binding NtrC family response regulator